jgi:iron(III) transport system ATP-binding protein
LLRSIAGLEQPDAGEIVLGDRTVFSSARGVAIPPNERQIGMVFQSYAIWPHLTVSENVGMPLVHGRQKLSRQEAGKRVRNALETVGLSHLADRPAPQLSGGQQQRVALARAIAVSTEFLLMDEPMSNLDARLREEVRNQILTIVRHYGTTVIYVTHDQEEAMSLADEIAFMRNGRILQRGSSTTLYDASITREVAEFFGPLNVLQGEPIGDGEVSTEIGVLQIDPIAARRSIKVVLGIRPERVQINPATQKNTFQGIVLDRIYLGSIKIYQITVGTYVFRAKSSENYEVGETVRICLPRESLHLYDDAGNSMPRVRPPERKVASANSNA